MTYWSMSAGDGGWAVRLDVRDLGGHLDVTRRARAGTLAARVSMTMSQVPLVGAMHSGFLRSAGFVRSKFLSAWLHGAEGVAFSGKSLDTFRTSIVRACWPRKLIVSNPDAVLSLLDVSDGCDPAVIRGRFRQMRRYLGVSSREVDRIYRSLDLVSAGRPGHGPIHFLLESPDELGFAWDSAEEGWLRPGLLPLRTLAGPYQHFKAEIWDVWRAKVAVFSLRVEVFGVALFWILEVPVTFFSLPTGGNGTRCCFVTFCVAALGTDSHLEQLKKDDVPSRFCGEVGAHGWSPYLGVPVPSFNARQGKSGVFLIDGLR